MELVGNARPESIRVVHRFFVEPLVISHAPDVRLPGKVRGRLKLALLLQDGINVRGLEIDDSFIGHERTSTRRKLSRASSGANSQEFILHTKSQDVIPITAKGLLANRRTYGLEG